MPRLLACSLVCSLWCSTAFADPTKKPEGTGHALLIALPGDKGDESDLRALADALPRVGFAAKNVLLLGPEIARTTRDRSPTLAAVRRELAALAKRAAAGDRVLLAVAGPGHQPKGDKETYLVPADGKPADVKTLLAVSELYKELAAGKAGTKLALLDVCRAASKCRPQDTAVPDGVAVLHACAAGETGQRVLKSGEGVFFHTVMRAFRGEADSIRDRNLTLRELQTFVEDQVAKLAKGQSPELLGKPKGTLSVARLSAGPGGLGAMLTVAINRVSKEKLANPNRPLVTVVFAGAAGDKAGLKAGDQVKAIDGTDVPSMAALKAALEQAGEAARIELTVSRATGERNLNVTLDKAPSDADEVRLLRPLAEKGDLEACHLLGHYHNTGTGVVRDHEAAVRWYTKAAEGGHAMAQNNLGPMYRDGQGVKVDAKRGAEWMKKSAEQGLALGQVSYGLALRDGTGVEKEDAVAVRWFRKAAESGLDRGQHVLGWMYDNGRGVEKDHKEAVAWYRKAADQGYALGQVAMGICCYFGRGVEKDHKEAVAWYRKAADQGQGHAQANLAICYVKGEGVAQDYAEAAKWYRLAGAQNIPSGLSGLGWLHREGQGGIKKDVAEAAKLFRKAAELGDAFGMYCLGRLYDLGEGVAKEHDTAAEWFTKAAKAGFAEACHELGEMYLTARGVKRDRAVAIGWLRQAAKAGHAPARKKLHDLGETP